MTRATKRQTQTFSFHVPSNRELFRTAVWIATFSDKGLCKLSVTEGKRVTPKTTARDPRLSELKAVLQKRLAGRDVNLEFDAFDLDGAPEFNLRVWKAMHAIPFGETRTYGEVAIDAGSPLGAPLRPGLRQQPHHPADPLPPRGEFQRHRWLRLRPALETRAVGTRRHSVLTERQMPDDQGLAFGTPLHRRTAPSLIRAQAWSVSGGQHSKL
jgi:hypothetical protein